MTTIDDLRVRLPAQTRVPAPAPLAVTTELDAIRGTADTYFEAQAQPAAVADAGAPVGVGGDVLDEVSKLQVAREARVREPELVRRLSLLARSLGKNFKLRLEPGKWWAYHFDQMKITYPIADMLAHNDDYSMGVICHELAHHLYSRIPPSDLIKNSAFHFLWNAVEDIRINKIISTRYAGVPNFMEELYQQFTDIPERTAKLGTNKVPRAKQFGLGFIYEWASGGKRDPLITDPDVKAAMNEAREAIARATRLPPGVDLRFDDLTSEEASAEAVTSSLPSLALAPSFLDAPCFSSGLAFAPASSFLGGSLRRCGAPVGSPGRMSLGSPAAPSSPLPPLLACFCSSGSCTSFSSRRS